MVSELLEGKIVLLITLIEKMLKGLSNQDYQQFDEKYIKVVMLIPSSTSLENRRTLSEVEVCNLILSCIQ